MTIFHEWITVRHFSNALDANYHRALLEVEGIDVHLQDEHAIGTNPMMDVMLGGIKLQVPVHQRPQALDILALRDAELGMATEEEPGCPKCGSQERGGPYTTIRTLQGLLHYLLTFFTAVHPLGVDRVYECSSCRTRYPVR